MTDPNAPTPFLTRLEFYRTMTLLFALWAVFIIPSDRAWVQTGSQGALVVMALLYALATRKEGQNRRQPAA